MSPNRSSSPETVILQSPVLHADTLESPKEVPPTPPPGIRQPRRLCGRFGEPLSMAIVTSKFYQQKIAEAYPGRVVKAYTTIHMLSTMTPPLSDMARAELVVVEIPMHEFTQHRYCHALKIFCLQLIGSAHHVAVIVTSPLRSKKRSQTKYVTTLNTQIRKWNLELPHF